MFLPSSCRKIYFALIEPSSSHYWMRAFNHWLCKCNDPDERSVLRPSAMFCRALHFQYGRKLFVNRGLYLDDCGCYDCGNLWIRLVDHQYSEQTVSSIRYSCIQKNEYKYIFPFKIISSISEIIFNESTAHFATKRFNCFSKIWFWKNSDFSFDYVTFFISIKTSGKACEKSYPRRHKPKNFEWCFSL